MIESPAVLMVEPLAIVRAGLRLLLEAGGFSVIGEVAEAGSAVEFIRRLRPDVVVMELPGLPEAEPIRRLLAVDPSVKILVLSSHTGARHVEAALRAGAVSYVLKSAAPQELFDAVRTVSEGRTYVSPALASALVEALARPGSAVASGLSLLTRREREVLQLIAEGLSAKDIATRLALSTRTVESHRAGIMRKLSVRKATDLLRLAIREGLISANNI